MNKTYFLSGFQASATSTMAIRHEAQSPERETVKICIIGSKRSIYAITRTLHHLGFTDVNAWSKPQPTGNPGEYISVLLRQVAFD